MSLFPPSWVMQATNPANVLLSWRQVEGLNFSESNLCHASNLVTIAFNSCMEPELDWMDDI